MLIYRVENKHGYGAFTGGLADIYDEGRDYMKHNSCRSHPGPNSENGRLNNVWRKKYLKGTYDDSRYLKFAFKDLDQLKEWFSCEKGRAAANSKAVVKVLSVNKKYVYEGDRQVVYDSSKTGKKVVAELSFLDFQPKSANIQRAA